MGLWSCGSNNNSDPVPKPAALSTATFHDPPLLLMMSGEEEVGLFSWLTELITEGLREGATIFVADKTTGWVLNFISDKLFGSETDRMLAEMNKNLEKIRDQLGDIEASLTALQDQMTVTKVVLKTYINNTKIHDAISRIQSAYDTQDNASLLGLSASAKTLDKTNATAVTQLKSDVSQYAGNYRYTMHEDIQSLYEAVCPSTPDVLSVLVDFANDVILTKADPTKVADPANALNTYKLLETYFSQILNYQTKALMIVSEINNYYDPTGGQTTAYFNNYKTMLKKEIAQFQWTVNYLMLNMVDYRHKGNFKNDMAYLQQGLARDDVFLQVFARSRFFTAQLLEGIGEPAYTLHGAVIIPRNYSSQGEIVQNITLQLDGPNNTRFTKQVTASPLDGRYPYTKWSASGKSSPDNHWSFYDFNFNDMTNDIPIGTYKVTLVDNGDNNTPWFHTTTDLGQVSVKYYDPQTFTEIDLSATKTVPPNAIKFGAFSGRWNWGYCRLSSSPMSSWVIPEKTTTRKKDNPELLKGTHYSPHKSTAGQINQLSLSLDQILYSGTKYVEYSLNLPFSVSRAPGDDKTVSASIFYSHGGYVMLDNPNGLDAYAWYRLIDTASKKRQDITSQYTTNYRWHPEGGPYYHQFDNVNEDLPTLFGVNSKLSILPNTEYNFDVDAQLAFTAGSFSHSQAYAHASLNAFWNMQLVYMNTYDIF